MVAGLLILFAGLLLAQAPQSSPSPEPAEATGGLPTTGLVLVSLVPKPVRLVCTIGTNNVVVDGAAEAISPGFSTGLIPWRPEDKPLRAAAKGYAGAELRPFLKAGEAPVVLLEENPSGRLAFRVIPNTEDRAGGFYDAINLTSDSSLQVQIDGRSVSLPKGKRIRIGTKGNLTFAAENGAGDSVDSGEFPPQHLIIFYRSLAGRTECVVVPDMLLQ